jgi:hypothetical protein
MHVGKEETTQKQNMKNMKGQSVLTAKHAKTNNEKPMLNLFIGGVKIFPRTTEQSINAVAS